MPIKWIPRPDRWEVMDAYKAMDSGSMTVVHRPPLKGREEGTKEIEDKTE